MTPQSIILGLLAAALLSLAAWMFLTYRRQPSALYYAVFLVGLAGIAIAQAGVFQSDSTAAALTVTRWGYVAGALTFSALLVFSFFFPIPSARTPRQPLWLLIVPLVFFGTLSLTSDTFLQHVSVTDSGSIESTGKFFWTFPAFVLVYVIWAIRNLAAKLSLSQGIQARSIRIFLLSLIIATLAGAIFDVLLPALGRERVPIGIYTSSVLFGLSAYIVTRK